MPLQGTVEALSRVPEHREAAHTPCCRGVRWRPGMDVMRGACVATPPIDSCQGKYSLDLRDASTLPWTGLRSREAEMMGRQELALRVPAEEARGDSLDKPL